MPTFAQKQNKSQKQESSKSPKEKTLADAVSHQSQPNPNLRWTYGKQAILQLLHGNPQSPKRGLDVEGDPNIEVETPTSTRLAHDSGQIPAPAPSPITLQPKLAVNTPGDVYEQEADHVAEQVMHMPEPQLHQACACGGGCQSCQTEQPSQEHQHLHAKHIGSSDSGQIEAPPIVHEVLSSPGQPLDAGTRGFMEPRFGHDFSRVRVHADTRAAQSAEAVVAHAYTVGSDVVVGDGHLAGSGSVDMRLLAHELAHVVQQEGNHAAGFALQRKVVTTQNITVVRFTIGYEVDSMLAYAAWKLTANGPLNDNDLAFLHAQALRADQTIDDNERMFLAALLDPVNAKKLHDEYPGGFVFPSENVEFPAFSITSANRTRIRDFGRSDDTRALGPSNNPDTTAGHAAELDRDIIAIAGRFAWTAQQALVLANTAGIPHFQVYFAMLTGASDSTPGDRAFAGAAYVMARIAKLPVADDLLRGRLKVDEVPSSVLQTGFKAQYMAEAGGGLKGDTVYLPTNFDVSTLDGQGTLVHELTHAAGDMAATSRTEVLSVRSEEDSYRREARYYLDAIAPLTDPARAQAVKQVGNALGEALGDVRVLCMALEALVYPIEESATIEKIIKDVNAVAYPLTGNELSKALHDSRKDLETGIRDRIIKWDKTMKNAVTVRAGFAGESALDSP